MTFTKEEIQGILGKESIPTPPKEKTFKNANFEKSIEEKRAELEILRIDNEIKRLSKPDIPETNYFNQMLEQQERHFNQMLEMNKQQSELRIEIEKLKILSENTGEFDEGSEAIEILKPFLPQIAANLKKGNLTPLTAPLTEPPLTQEMKGGDNPEMEIQTTAEFEEYQRKIRNGNISEEEAYEDFKENMPPSVVKRLGHEGFKKEFEKIRKGKAAL